MIMYVKKYQHTLWLRTRQSIPNRAENWNLMRKLKLSSQVSKSWKLIGWQVSRETTTNKMADRCGESNNVLIQSLSIVSRENALKKTPNKRKTTGQKCGFQKQVWKYEALNKILEEYYGGLYATVRTKDGGQITVRDSFRIIVTAVDWYLTEKEYKRSVILERGFEVWSKFLTKKPYYSGNKAKASGRTGKPWHDIKATSESLFWMDIIN